MLYLQDAFQNDWVYVRISEFSIHFLNFRWDSWSRLQPVRKPKWFYINQMVSKHCTSTLVNIKSKEVTVELVIKWVTRVTLDHWRWELISLSHYNFSEEELGAVWIYLSTFEFYAIVPPSQSVINHKQFWSVYIRETFKYFKTFNQFSSEATFLKREHVKCG